jgi:phytol kinase
MGIQIGLTIIFLIGFSLLLVFVELVYRRLQLKGEITRKFAHFSATLSTITFPYLFEDHWYVLALALIFFILLYGSRNNTYLRSIHDIDRISAGSYLLPVSVYLTFLVSYLLNDKFLYILPILILAICDPVAGILGINLQQYNHRIRILGRTLNKTWLGSLSFFISCYVLCIIALYFNQQKINPETFLIALVITLVGTLAELFSWKGIDNLMIPLSVLFTMILLL